jgi:hypothetical protein
VDQADQGAGGPQETVGRLLEASGGKLLGYWYAFGDHDG